MARMNEVHTVAFVGDYFPRKCGIATFTHDLHRSIAERYPEVDCCVVPVDDIEGGYDYPPEVRFQIAEQDFDSYLRAADFLNFSNADVVCLQHEFGIYGGNEGSHVLGLLRDLRMPVVTTLHTVLSEPNAEQRRIIEQFAKMSARLIVMSERGSSLLQSVYGIPESKIALIAHGIPDMPFVDPKSFKGKFGVEGKQVALTFGLLAPNKGIEHALRAVPAVLKEFPDFVYMVLGATHPNLVRAQGEAYRLSLERLARDLGITKHVIFYNRFVELRELTEFIGAADLYVTPYLNQAQITSGTLAYAFGCGKAVISTPYWHAEELLADGRGVLVPFADSAALAREICGLLADEPRRNAMRKRAYMLGREMIWSNVAHLYMETFQQARSNLIDQPDRQYVVPTLDERPLDLPELRLDHLLNMTDSTGIFQHATITIPQFEHGYCTDDTARALILTVLLEELGNDSPQVLRAATTYAAFVNAAFDAERGRFRNFMTIDRRWIEDEGSDDCYGRALWALGTCVGRSRRADFQYWAVEMFNRALPMVADLRSPRAYAFALLGIHEYFHRLSGDRRVDQMREDAHRSPHQSLRSNRDRRLALVRRRSQLRQRPALPGLDRQRPPRRQRARPRNRFDARSAGCSTCNARITATCGRSAATASFAAAANVPSSTSNRWKSRRWFPVASLPTLRPATRSGWPMPGSRSNGSWDETTWAWTFMTPAPAAAATACIRTASIRTKGPNRRSPFKRPWPS